MNTKKEGKLKKFLKGAWDKTDGWKTVSGIALHLIWEVIHHKVEVDNFTTIAVHTGIGNLTGVGAFYKVQKFKKSEVGKKILNLIFKK